jgi:glycosyltransferase involved in cell wall biosynthesis
LARDLRSPAIGIDGSRISGRPRTGTETYAHEILKALASLADPDELCVYLNANIQPDDMPGGLDIVPLRAPRLWTHGRLSWEMVRRTPSVLFVPSHVIPAYHPRSVVTIHDLAYVIHPEAFTPRERRELDIATRWNARAATKIIAVSRRTRLDLIERYGTDPEKIVVIHHGVSSRFTPADPVEIERVRRDHGLRREYVLCVGTLHPRKNYPVLIAAFDRAVQGGLQADLAICGDDAGPHADSTLRAIASSPNQERIHLLQYVDAADLPPLYSAASLVMLASLYEGFGMPALEAMSCGAPVAVSSTGSLPEVTGNAARYVNPTDVQSISSVMLEMCCSTDLNQRFRSLGRQWASRFTWQRSGALTLSVLRSIRDGKVINDERLGWNDLAASPSQSQRTDGETQ